MGAKGYPKSGAYIKSKRGRMDQIFIQKLGHHSGERPQLEKCGYTQSFS